MGKYSSDSDSSDYHRKKKSRRNRSSSRSSSSSRYSSRSKKSKKSKKYHHSRSSERSSKYRRRSREGSSSSSRVRKSKHGKHSRRRSRSSSHSKLSSTRSPPYSSRSHSKDTRSPSYSRSRRRSHSPSPSYPNILNDKKNLFDGAELLAKLNKAATEAMSENTKKLESLFADNLDSRSNAIDEINAPNFIQKSFTSNKEDAPVLTDVSNFVNFNNVKEEPGNLLHANLLIEDLNDKINRWVKKLHQIRQKSLFGEPLVVD